MVDCPQVKGRTSVESPEEEQESSHQVTDDNFTENSSDTRHYDISGEEEFQEKCIIPDRQNLADEFQEQCSSDQVDQSTGSEVLVENISYEEVLGKPVSDKLSKIVNTLFLNDKDK